MLRRGQEHERLIHPDSPARWWFPWFRWWLWGWIGGSGCGKEKKKQGKDKVENVWWNRSNV